LFAGLQKSECDPELRIFNKEKEKGRRLPAGPICTLKFEICDFES